MIKFFELLDSSNLVFFGIMAVLAFMFMPKKGVGKNAKKIVESINDSVLIDWINEHLKRRR